MRKARRPLIVLHPDPLFRERLRKAGGAEYQFRMIAQWNALREVIRGSSPQALIVVDPYVTHDDRRDEFRPSPGLRALLTDFPSHAVVAAMEVSPARHEDVRMLGEWGVAQVICIRHDTTPFAITQRLRAARGGSLRALLERALTPETPRRTRAIMRAAIDVAAVGGCGHDLARSLGIHRRTMLRWTAHAGLPPPRELLAWMRILQAAELLDDPGRTILDVAMVCGYSSDSGLRRVTQKFLGASPTDIRNSGAFGRASREFLNVLAEYRKAEGRDTQ